MRRGPSGRGPRVTCRNLGPKPIRVTSPSKVFVAEELEARYEWRIGHHRMGIIGGFVSKAANVKRRSNSWFWFCSKAFAHVLRAVPWHNSVSSVLFMYLFFSGAQWAPTKSPLAPLVDSSCLQSTANISCCHTAVSAGGRCQAPALTARNPCRERNQDAAHALSVLFCA